MLLMSSWVLWEAPCIGLDFSHIFLLTLNLHYFGFISLQWISYATYCPVKFYISTYKGMFWYCHGAGPEFDITEFEMLNVEQFDSLEPSSPLTLKPTPMPRSISNPSQPLSPPEPSQDKTEAPEVPKDSEKEGCVPANSAQLRLLKRRAPEVASLLVGWLVVCPLGCWWPGYH